MRAVRPLLQALNDAGEPLALASVAFSPDGKSITSGPGGVRIWDSSTELPVGNLCTCSERRFIYPPDYSYLRLLSKITQRQPRASLRELTIALEDEERSVRLVAAFLLGQLGQDAKAAVPMLARVCEEADEELSHVARDALRNIQNPQNPQNPEAVRG